MKKEVFGEAWLGSVGGAEFLFVFELERGRTYFLEFCLLLGEKKAEGQGFLTHRSAIYQVVEVEKVQELERTVLPEVNRNGRTCSADGLKEKVDMSRSKVEFMHFVW